MLSPAETDLVRREPSIPGLATVLDAEVFLARLRCCAPGIDLRTAQILFIKYTQTRSWKTAPARVCPDCWDRDALRWRIVLSCYRCSRTITDCPRCRA